MGKTNTPYELVFFDGLISIFVCTLFADKTGFPLYGVGDIIGVGGVLVHQKPN